jgi:ankyrin repeat protein
MSNNSLEVIQYLISVGADVNARNKFGKTPLHYTAKKDWSEVRQWSEVQYLISAGADVHAKDDDGNIPLDYVRSVEVKRILRDAMTLQTN